MHSAEPTIREQIMPAVNDCYERALRSDVAREGKLVVSLKIAADGHVETATRAASQGTLSDDLVDCIIAAARRAKFEAPGPLGSTIMIPFNLQRR